MVPFVPCLQHVSLFKDWVWYLSNRTRPRNFILLAAWCSYCVSMEVVLATVYLLPFKHPVSVPLHTGSREEEPFAQLERNRNFRPGLLSSKSLVSQTTDESDSIKKFLLKR